jgi:hypothetical protein
MSYHQKSITGAREFFIPKERRDEAEQAVLKLDCFSEYDNLLDAMLSVNWEYDEDDHTGHITDAFPYESYSCRDEDALWKALAPFVQTDCYITMSGEDNEIWQIYFKDGKVYHRRRIKNLEFWPAEDEPESQTQE